MEKKHEISAPAEDIICGRNPVIEALKSGANLDTVYIDGNGGSLSVIRRLAKENGIVVKDAIDAKLSKLSGGASHQGVVAVGACGEYVSLDDILAVAEKKGTPPFIIICDEIEDPHNLGAIIRTAETSGADGVIIPKRRSAGLNATVFKTSAGAASYVPVARVSNLASAIDELKERYDYVIIDSAPIAMVSDTYSLARYANVTVYVTRSNYTKRSLVRYMNNALARRQLNNVAVVLNDSNPKMSQGYGYGYGQDKD